MTRMTRDKLDEIKENWGYGMPMVPSTPGIECIAEIEATLRRCSQAYNVLVSVLVSATSESFSRTQKALATAGLGDLTAARLARLTSRVKWPWLEPRIKACQKQLKAVKVDLLLNLHIASLAKHRNR